MKALSGRLFFFLLMILFLAERSADAYIDPGTGSMLWQLLFAAGVGGLFYLRTVIAWLGKLRKRGKADGSHHSARTPGSKSSERSRESPP